ncbi:efflux transporter outer membrane subunit [Cupriavidus plantarum]|uniref:efflux transporter outer membrane subunit n=1 Tax=Cupriavidus plantarum TaxID=942865 RepID=UPI000EAC10CE|nr:efflux transporter outer membrane subunit [Cupriavidus plantarum]RLK44365.1 NodT family efflux transporter outer membrane factor (OMF) lipoprotein [Cupriavidus plantarum]
MSVTPSAPPSVPPTAVPPGAPRTVVTAAVTTIALAALALLSGCTVGPDYVKPTLSDRQLPANWREQPPPDPDWKVAQPASIDAGQDWWTAYGDTTLDGLVDAAMAANQTLRQAEASYRQARALTRQARAGLFPTLGAEVSTGRSRAVSNGVPSVSNNHAALLDASWEVDLWGLVRRAVEAARDTEQATAADLAAARLSIQAEVAQDYIQLRITDVLKDLFDRTVAADEESLKLTQSQFRAGIATDADVSLAQVTLESARAQGIDLDVQRTQLEHAIAVLTGQAPGAFALARLPSPQDTPAGAGADADTGRAGGAAPGQAPSPMPAASASFPMRLLAIPPGLPSTLLERRPDIAAAERRMAAANAEIGVARAAYYPQLTLSASGGGSSANLANWFIAPGRVWALGAGLAQTIFDGGLRSGRNDQAVAAYDQSAAAYRQTVLSGLQEVEDSLSALRVLDREVVVQDRAVDAARRAERVSLAQYRAGTAQYLSVITAQQLALTNARTAITLRGRAFAASVALVKATGGGWQSSALQSPPPMTTHDAPLAAVGDTKAPATATATATVATTDVVGPPGHPETRANAPIRSAMTAGPER